MVLAPELFAVDCTLFSRLQIVSGGLGLRGLEGPSRSDGGRTTVATKSVVRTEYQRTWNELLQSVALHGAPVAINVSLHGLDDRRHDASVSSAHGRQPPRQERWVGISGKPRSTRSSADRPRDAGALGKVSWGRGYTTVDVYISSTARHFSIRYSVQSVYVRNFLTP